MRLCLLANVGAPLAAVAVLPTRLWWQQAGARGTGHDGSTTVEVEGEVCMQMTAKIYYTNPAGYAGWSTTAKSNWRAVKPLSGSDRPTKSYHAATR